MNEVIVLDSDNAKDDEINISCEQNNRIFRQHSID